MPPRGSCGRVQRCGGRGWGISLGVVGLFSILALDVAVALALALALSTVLYLLSAAHTLSLNLSLSRPITVVLSRSVSAVFAQRLISKLLRIKQTIGSMHLTRSRIQFARHRHEQTGAHMHKQAETRAKAREKLPKLCALPNLQRACTRKC